MKPSKYVVSVSMESCEIFVTVSVEPSESKSSDILEASTENESCFSDHHSDDSIV